MSLDKPTVICLMGPTASGKTQVALELAERLPCEIISVDSAMIYRGMNIGTAKPEPAVLKKIPHRLIDICDPTERYSVAQFQEDALHAISEIIAAGKTPLLVGGTMMYFSILQKGIAPMPSADPHLRAEFMQEMKKQGLSAQHQRLQQVDPEAAARIHPHDQQRIQRALEVYHLTGKTISALQKESRAPLSEYHVVNIAISPEDRSVLHDRIAARFATMLALGFIDEVKRLMTTYPLQASLPSMRSVGYRQAWDYLHGILSYEVMQEKAIVATRQLAKRQLTWLRHWPLPLRWFIQNTIVVDQILEFVL